MPQDIGELLRRGAGVPESRPDVGAAWERGIA